MLCLVKSKIFNKPQLFTKVAIKCYVDIYLKWEYFSEESFGFVRFKIYDGYSVNKRLAVGILYSSIAPNFILCLRGCHQHLPIRGQKLILLTNQNLQVHKRSLQFIGSIQILCQVIQDKWFLFKASQQ